MGETIEMPTAPAKNNFLNKKGRRALWLLLLLALCCLIAGCICWLALGKVKSVVARVDGTVYTVAPQISASLKNLYAQPGELVSQGQELASLSVGDLPHAEQTPSIYTQLAQAQSMEKHLAERLAAAQREEERLRQLMEESVMHHVRAQLAMRSISAKNSPSYQQAANNEKLARENMEQAREHFDNVSRARANTEKELRRLRAAAKSGRNLPAAAPAPAAPAKMEGALFSPINGRIVSVNAAPGQHLAPGQIVFYILPAGKDLGSNALWIQAWFPADSIEAMANGQPAVVRFQSGLEMKGQINEIFGTQPLPESYLAALPENDPLRREAKKIFLPCHITLENTTNLPLEKLEPGMPVACEVQTRSILGFRGF